MGPEPLDPSVAPGAHIWGWMTPDELWWLHDTAKTMTSIVEVGSLHGRSAYALASACPGPVYCIDPWDDVGGKCRPSFMGSVGDVFPNVVPVQGWSPMVVAQYDLPDVDMVFIDGAHDEAQVRADIAVWLPKTKKLLCGHDYSLAPQAGFPGVRKVVDEVFGDRMRPGNFVDTDFDRYSIWAVDV